MPKVIYCIHVLSHLLAKKGLAPHIKDLQGRLQFTEEVLGNAAKDLDDSGVAMPEFGNIKKELDKELKIEETDEERKAREERERLESLSKQFEMNPDGLIKIQAMCRGRIHRQAYLDQLRKYKDHEDAFTKLQAAYKGKKAREEYLKLKKFYQSKVKQIVKIQSWWRGVQCRNNYRALKLSKFVNVAVIQEYLALFESSDEELDEDRIVEELRAKVIQKIRDNLSLEANLNILDEKVALLIKNRISLEEVAKFKSKDMRAALAKSAAQSQAEQAVLTFRGRDKATNDKRKKYEALFYLLQTQPVYLAGLMFTLTRTSGGAATKFLEQVILTLYGYAQNTREEYLFLRLIENSINMEVTVTKQSDEVVKENPVFVKLVLQYIRGAKERDYLRGLFRPLLDLVLKNSELELELDPIAIYKGIIRQEEISTGKSSLPHDITAEAAAKNPQVKEIQLKNFALITNITDTFLSSIIKSADKMPFGIRFIAMRMRQIMQEKYPGPEHEKNINLWVGNMLYYRYLNPVIVAPEAFDVIETSISPIQRKNLAEIARLLQQVSVYDPKKADAAVNEKGSYADQAAQYFKSASVKFAQFLKEASNTVTCEEYFDMTEFVDSGRVEKHTVYITPDEIVQLHNCLHENLIQLPVIPNDPLGTIMRELGEPPKNGTAAKGPGSEIVLHLSDRFAGAVDNAEVELRKLQKETKRIILTILRFATGKTLLDILETPCTNAQEKAFAAYVAQQETNRKLVSESQTLGKKASLEMLKASSMEMLHEESRQSKGTLEDLNVASAPLATPAYKTPDGKNMNFAQLKVKALENMAKLEKHDKVSKADNYQSMLDAIVQDMLNKQRRRQQRRTEIQRFRTTMANLTEKSVFLKESLQSYNNYIDGCMAQLNKKGGYFNLMLGNKRNQCYSVSSISTCKRSRRAARKPNLDRLNILLALCMKREYLFLLTTAQ